MKTHTSFSVLFVLGISFSNSAHGQESGLLSPMIPATTYADRLQSASNQDFAFVLRFNSDERSESQIALIVRPNGTVQCSRYRSKTHRGLPNPALPTGISASSDVVEEQVQVSKDEAYSWQRTFFSAASLSEAASQASASRYHRNGQLDVTLHGDLYRVWYSDFDGTQYWRLLGAAMQNKRTFAKSDDLIGWMNAVRTAVESKLAKRGGG